MTGPNQLAARGRPPEPKALHRAVAARMRARMSGGHWPPGTILPSLRQLAAEFGVGERTVRLAVDALKEEDRIAVTGRRRLEAKAPSGAITTTSGTILEILGGNLHTVLKSSNMAALQRGIEFGAGDLWAPLLIVHDEHLRKTFPSELLDYPLRGILLAGQLRAPVLRRCEKINLPVVLVDRPAGRTRLHALAVDNAAACYDATRRLITFGHRRLAFVRFVQLGLRDIDPDSRERQAGFERACREHGIRENAWSVLNTFANDTAGALGLRRLLKERPRVTGLVCVDRGRAELVLEAARHSGLTAPRDLSVVAFQGKTESAAGLSGPQVDFFALGRRAANLLREPARPLKQERIGTVWNEGRTLGSAPQ